MKRLIPVLLLCILSFGVAHAAIDTISVFSTSMAKNIKCVVITPSNYERNNNRFPTVYLLHGARGNYANWVTRIPDMQQLADDNQSLLICPDGNYMSWYFDSPVDSSIRYETFIAKELVDHIDTQYKTINNRQHRAITGLSMGGNGAIFIAFRHAQIFGAVGSMSGAFDIALIAKPYGIDKILGDVKTNAGYYKDFAVINLIDHYPADSLAIIIDCGAQDFISYMTKAVHEKMTRLGIPHDYTLRPGRHDWNYWGTSIRYQLIFFKEYFKKGDAGL